jgi:hypothetical protein
VVLIREVHSYIVHTVFHHPKLLIIFLPLTRGGGTIVGLLVELARPAGRGGDNFLASQGLRAQFNGGEKSGSNNDEESVVWQGR